MSKSIKEIKANAIIRQLTKGENEFAKAALVVIKGFLACSDEGLAKAMYMHDQHFETTAKLGMNVLTETMLYEDAGHVLARFATPATITNAFNNYLIHMILEEEPICFDINEAIELIHANVVEKLNKLAEKAQFALGKKAILTTETALTIREAIESSVKRLTEKAQLTMGTSALLRHTAAPTTQLINESASVNTSPASKETVATAASHAPVPNLLSTLFPAFFSRGARTAGGAATSTEVTTTAIVPTKSSP